MVECFVYTGNAYYIGAGALVDIRNNTTMGIRITPAYWDYTSFFSSNLCVDIKEYFSAEPFL